MRNHIVTLKTCQGLQKFVRLADGSFKPYHEHHAPTEKEGRPVGETGALLGAGSGSRMSRLVSALREQAQT